MKQAVVARSDLGMSAGKLAAQVAHASLAAYENAGSDARREWRRTGQTKVVLEAADESVIRELKRSAGARGVPFGLVRDAGRTQVEPGTVTAIAIGPARDPDIDALTGELPLY